MATSRPSQAKTSTRSSTSSCGTSRTDRSRKADAAELRVRFSDWVTILPGSARRDRRDRRLASRAGMPPLPRGGRGPIEPPRAGRRPGALANAARRRRAEGRPPRGRAVLSAGARHAPRRASGVQLDLRLRRADMMMMIGRAEGGVRGARWRSPRPRRASGTARTSSARHCSCSATSTNGKGERPRRSAGRGSRGAGPCGEHR